MNDGKVEIGSEKNSVLISSSSFSIQAIIYEDGTLEGYWNNNGKGEFSSTKEMKYSWGNYSPGGSSTYNITGEKIKKFTQLYCLAIAYFSEKS